MTETGAPDSGLAFILRAFRSRNYRLYFTGQGISLIGTWMQITAQNWLVYRLTKSPLLLGLVGFASQAPQMLLTPITGVLADRWNRYKMMIRVQTSMMFIALAMAILFFTHLIQIWHIIFLSIGMGLMNALDAPNRHAFVADLMENRTDLPGAIAMNSTMFNSARLIGPPIAGLIIQWTGEGVCFLSNSISFLGIIFTLLAMKIPHPKRPPRLKKSIRHELREGFHYTFGSPSLRRIIIHFAWISFSAMSFNILMPIMAKEILHGGADSMGFLLGALGIGAIISSLVFASRKKPTGLRRMAGIGSIVLGISLIILSFSRSFIFSLLIMGIAGFGMISQMNATNTFLQKMVDDDKRARVMAYYLLAFFGTVPLGSLLMGGLAKILGTLLTIRLAGIAALAGSIAYFWFSSIHRENQQKPTGFSQT